MPDLTFTQPQPGGRILLMLGQHQVGEIDPRGDFIMVAWYCSLPGSGMGAETTEQAAKNALLAEARDWLRKAGVK
jgi:hypothetical protein